MRHPSTNIEAPFEAHVLEADGAATVRLAGTFDLACSKQFEERIASVLGRRPGKLVLDLGGVTFIDSSALALILKLWSQCRRDGFDLTISSLSGQVARVFRTVGLDRALPIVERGAAADANGADEV